MSLALRGRPTLRGSERCYLSAASCRNEDRLWAHELAAGPTFLGSQQLAFERQAAPLLGCEIDTDVAGRRRDSHLEDPNLLVQVVAPPRHPLIHRVRAHRDDEWQRRRNPM